MCEIDLTEEIPLKSQRKLAGDPIISIDLCSPEVPKEPISFEKALAIVDAPLPSLSSLSTPESQNKSSEAATNCVQHVQDGTIDLTGECYLQNYHNNSPMFQNSGQIRATRSKTRKGFFFKQKSPSQELDFDYESITLRIKINQIMKKFTYKREKRFFDVFKIISEGHNVQISDILLYNEKGKRILPEQTPDDVKFKISSLYSKRLSNIIFENFLIQFSSHSLLLFRLEKQQSKEERSN